MKTPITSRQSIIDFYNAFSNCKFEVIRNMLHPECTLEFPGTFHPNIVQGCDQVIALLTHMQDGLNGSLRFHTKWAVYEDDMVAAHWYTTAKTEHGGAYMNRGVAWFKLKDGLVYEFLDFLDTEVLTAFWPGGIATKDFNQADRLVNTLYQYAPEEVQIYFDHHVKL